MSVPRPRSGPSAAADWHPAAAPSLLDQMSFTFGWMAKPALWQGGDLSVRVELTDLGTSFGLRLGEACAVDGAPAGPVAVLTLPAEAWVRLVSGRLAPQYTPPGVETSGDVTLDALRAVFPGTDRPLLRTSGAARSPGACTHAKRHATRLVRL